MENMIKYLFKEPGKDFELREHPIDYSIRKDMNQEWILSVGSASLGRNLYIYFDDLGIYDYSVGKIKYNFNLPSNSSEFQNQIFGNVIIEKVNFSGEPVDISIEDIDFVKSIVFTVSDKDIYTINHPVVKQFMSEDFIAAIEREYNK